jgi:hypothetical protein
VAPQIAERPSSGASRHLLPREREKGRLARLAPAPAIALSAAGRNRPRLGDSGHDDFVSRARLCHLLRRADGEQPARGRAAHDGHRGQAVRIFRPRGNRQAVDAARRDARARGRALRGFPRLARLHPARRVGIWRDIRGLAALVPARRRPLDLQGRGESVGAARRGFSGVFPINQIRLASATQSRRAGDFALCRDLHRPLGPARRPAAAGSRLRERRSIGW